MSRYKPSLAAAARSWLALIGCLALLAGASACTTGEDRTDADAAAASAGCDAFGLIPCERQVARASLLIPGAGLRLVYASDRVPGRTEDAAPAAGPVGLGGWSLDVLGQLDPGSGRLAARGGQLRLVDPLDVDADGGRYAVASFDGSTVDVFAADGRALAVHDAVTGAKEFTFSWGPHGLVGVSGPDGPLLTVLRDPAGLPLRLDSANGSRVELGTVQGRIAAVRMPDGGVVRAATTPTGLLTSLTDQTGNATRYAYDARGRVVSSTQDGKKSPTVTYTRTVKGGTATVVTALPSGARVKDSVQGAGSSVTRGHTDASGHTTTLREKGGNRTFTLPGGEVTTLTLGPDPRWGMTAPVITTLNGPRGSKAVRERTGGATAEITPAGPIRDVITVEGARWAYAFDPVRRVATSTDPSGRVAEVAFDTAGRVVRRSVAGGVALAYRYTTSGRLAAVTVGTGSDARTWKYGYEPGQVTVTDPAGGILVRTYDTDGALVSVSGAGTPGVTLDHDAAGRLTGFADAGGHHTTLARDDLGRPAVTSTSGGDGPVRFTTYAYDADGRLSGESWNGGGQTVTRDPAGRVTGFGPGTSIAYDAAGRVTSAKSPQVSTSWTYDKNGSGTARLSGPFDVTATRVRDARGRVVRESVGGEAPVEYGYDSAGRVVRAGDLRIDRDPRTGSIVAEHLGSLEMRWELNQFGEPKAEVATRGGEPVAAVRWERDGLGRVASETRSRSGRADSKATYTYDTSGRVTSVTRDGARTSYTYDRSGNLLTSTAPDGSRSVSAYDAGNNLVERDGVTYTYDGAGRLATTASGDAKTVYAYDATGALERVTMPDGTRVDYANDGFGRRVARTSGGSLTAGFVYFDDLHPAAELGKDGKVAARYVRAGGDSPAYVRKGSADYLELVDAAGSPLYAIGATDGSVADSVSRDPWGQVRDQAAPGFQSIGFAGGIADPGTGLVRFGARDYSPESARWIAPDPLGVAGGDPNLYAYVSGDPVNRTDPSGLCDYIALTVTGTVKTPIGGIQVSTGAAVGGHEFGGVASAGLGVGAEAGFGAVITCMDKIDRSSPARLDDFGGLGNSVDVGFGPGSAGGDVGFDNAGHPTSAGGHVGIGPFGGASGGVGWTTTGCLINCGPTAPGDDGTDDPEEPGDGSEPPGCSGPGGPGCDAPELPPGGAPSNPCDIGTCDNGQGSAPAFPTGRGPSSRGEPHLRTADGAFYAFQAVGEFVALSSDDDDFQIQLRQKPVHQEVRRWSANSAVAVSIGGDRVVVERTADGISLAVDGKPAVASGMIELPGGGRVERGPDTVTIWGTDGTGVGVLANPVGIDVLTVIPDARKGHLHGLLGPYTGRSGDSVVGRDGTTYPLEQLDDYDTLYHRYGDGWRVTQADSLFDYRPGESTATFTDRAYPDRSQPEIPASARAAAEQVCKRLGLTGELLASCVFDVAVTGDAGYAASTAASAKGIAGKIAGAPRPGTSGGTTGPGGSAQPGATPRPGGPVRDGQTVNGKLTTAGGTVGYDLDLGDATVFRLYDVTGASNKITIDLVGPPANDSPGFTVTSAYQYVVRKGAHYRLEVSAPDGLTGAFSFRLVTAKERRMDARVGDRITGDLNTPGRVDLYAIESDHAVTVRLADGTPCEPVAVAAVDDVPAPHVYTPLRACWDVDLVTMEPGKRYLIAVWNDEGRTAPYSFRIVGR